MFDIVIVKKLVKKKVAHDLMTLLIGIAPKVFLKGVEARMEAHRLEDARGISNERLLARLNEEEDLREKERLLKIGAHACEDVRDDGDPTNTVDAGWRAKFVANASRIDNEAMQVFWGRLLAEEINEPGRFALQTLDILANMSAQDARSFEGLCRFIVTIDTMPSLVMLDAMTDETFDRWLSGTGQEVNFTVIQDLESLGLVNQTRYGFSWPDGKVTPVPPLIVRYGKDEFRAQKGDGKFDIDLGRMVLTRAGREIASTLAVEPLDGYLKDCISKWTSEGVTFTKV